MIEAIDKGISRYILFDIYIGWWCAGGAVEN